MENLFLYFMYTIVVLSTVSLYLFLLGKKQNVSSSKMKFPPGTTGWPLLGENIQFASSGPKKFIAEKMDKYSAEVFKTSFLGEKIVVFCGPAGNKFLFSSTQDNIFAPWVPESMKKALVFPSFADKYSVKEIGAIQHGFLHEILKPEALKRYIPVMDSMARDHLVTEWSLSKQVIKVHKLARKYTFALACRLFMNVEDPEHVERLARTFTRVLSGLFSLPINLPGTAYNAALKGGEMVREELLKVIRERKNELMEDDKTSGRDILSRMLLLKDENGNFLNEKEICNNIVGLLFASYDTTSSSLAFVLKYLAELPHIYDKVYQEHMEIAKTKDPQELLNWEDIQKMKYSWNVVCEALRLTPPSPGAFKEVVNDFSYAGFTIPKGWKAHWSVYSTHHSPKYFVNPEEFNPTRFEGSGPAPYTFVPFGGGARMCPGKEYARLEILVFMYNVVTKFKMEKMIPNEKIINQAILVSANGIPIRIQPHEA